MKVTNIKLILKTVLHNFGHTMKRQAAKTMNEIMQQKIDEIQNPKDCLKAKLFICEPSKNKRGNGMPDCGWGCLGKSGCRVKSFKV